MNDIMPRMLQHVSYLGYIARAISCKCDFGKAYGYFDYRPNERPDELPQWHSLNEGCYVQPQEALFGQKFTHPLEIVLIGDSTDFFLIDDLCKHNNGSYVRSNVGNHVCKFASGAMVKAFGVYGVALPGQPHVLVKVGKVVSKNQTHGGSRRRKAIKYMPDDVDTILSRAILNTEYLPLWEQLYRLTTMYRLKNNLSQILSKMTTKIFIFHSCLWDISIPLVYTDGLSSEYVRFYSMHLRRVVKQLQKSHNSSIILLRTGGLVNAVDVVPSANSHPHNRFTRTRKNQAIVNRAIRKTAADLLQCGLLDFAEMAQGYAYYAKDGRHYRGDINLRYWDVAAAHILDLLENRAKPVLEGGVVSPIDA